MYTDIYKTKYIFCLIFQGKCVDLLDNCDTLIKENGGYCSDITKWNGIARCAKTCGLCNYQSKKKCKKHARRKVFQGVVWLP